MEEYIDVVRMAGFEDIRVGCMVDVFSGSPHESDAAEFETRGMVFRAHKPLAAS